VTPPLDEWARAYAATQVIEVPIVVGWLRGLLPLHEAAAIAVLATTLTHPALWYLWPRFEPGWMYLGAGEAVVWTVEAALYTYWLRRRGAPDAVRAGVLTACLANGSSMLTGLLFYG